MIKTELTEQEKAATGFTHKYVVKYTDTDDAATTAAVKLDSYTAGTLFTAAGYRLVTAYEDTSPSSSISLNVGWNGATTDDDDGLLDNYQLAADQTEVFFGDGNGAAFATLRTGYAALDAGDLEATFNSTANLSTLTAGEVHIFVGKVDLTKL